MRSLVCLFITLYTFVCAFAAPTQVDLPPEVHPTFADTYQRAQQAYEGGEVQKALAMLNGIVYPNGVAVNIDVVAAGSRTQVAQTALNRAAHTWSIKLEGDSPILVVDPKTKADIKIVLTDKIPKSSHDTLGLIDLKKEYRWNNVRHEVHNKGTIYVMRTWNGRPLTEDQMTEIITHELGHLLGLADVSDTNMLMGPMVPGQTLLAPRPNEIKAIQTLRAKTRSLINQFNVSSNLQVNFLPVGFMSVASLTATQSSYSHQVDMCTCMEHSH